MSAKHTHHTPANQILARAFCLALLSALFLGPLACGKKETTHSASSEEHHVEGEEDLSVFNIDLLDLSAENAEKVFTFPKMQIRLDEKKSYVIELQVVVECLRSEITAEMEENTSKYQGVFEIIFSTRSRAQITTTANRMNLHDEIIERLDRELQNNGFEPGVREIYFTKYHIVRNYQ